MNNSIFRKAGLLIAMSLTMSTANAAFVAPSSEPFTECPAKAFLIQGKKASVYGVSLSTGYYQTLEKSLSSNVVNGVGFSVHDNYIYGWSKGLQKMVRFGQSYELEEFNVGGDLPGSSHFYVGDVSVEDNAYYVYRPGNKDSQWGLYKIPLDSSSDDYLNASRVVDGSNSGMHLKIFDIAFHPDNGLAYTVDNNGRLYHIDVHTGSYEFITKLTMSDGTETTGTFGAIYFSLDGTMYYSKNQNGYIYSVNPTSENPVPELYAYGPKSGQNDGARCALAPVSESSEKNIDFGSAPDSYKTSLSLNGARHSVVDNNLFLGSGRDAESDAFIHPVSDDNVGEDKNDGVEFLSDISAGDSILVNVTSSGSGQLTGWIDWNKDSQFDASAESIGQYSVNAGAQFISIDVPLDIEQGDTWARFRVSSEAAVTPTGGAGDGEVEDYIVSISACTSNCNTSSYPSADGWVTLGFEDLWPSNGDYDFNDLVVVYRNSSTAHNGNVMSIKMEGSISAVGAEWHNGFGVAIPNVLRSHIDEGSITYKLNGVTIDPEHNVLEEGVNEAIIIVTTDAWQEVLPSPVCGLYRTEVGCDAPVEFNYEINVPFKSDSNVSMNTIGSLVLNPFLFGTPGEERADELINGFVNPLGEYVPGPFDSVDDYRGLEVHLKGLPPTELVNRSAFGVRDDKTDLTKNLYYLNSKGLPYALETAGAWKHPLEGNDITEVYPEFIPYVLSEGATNLDWQDLEKATPDKLYPH